MSDVRPGDHDLLTPHALQQAMLAKSTEVDAALDNYREAVKRHVEADKSRRVSFNTSLLVIDEGTAQERKAKAEQAASELIYAEEMAEGLRDVCKEVVRAKLAQLSALQSMASTIKEEMRLAR